MWNASRVPQTGQTIQTWPMYHMGIKKRQAQRCIGKRTILSRQVPFHKAHEQGLRLPASTN
jgi:hypothetical protein